MKRFVESVADLGFVAWGGEENFKRALEWLFLHGFYCGVRRFLIGRLYGFRLWARRNSRRRLHDF